MYCTLSTRRVDLRVVFGMRGGRFELKELSHSSTLQKSMPFSLTASTSKYQARSNQVPVIFMHTQSSTPPSLLPPSLPPFSHVFKRIHFLFYFFLNFFLNFFFYFFFRFFAQPRYLWGFGGGGSRLAGAKRTSPSRIRCASSRWETPQASRSRRRVARILLGTSPLISRQVNHLV